MKIDVVFYGRLKEVVNMKQHTVELNQHDATIESVVSTLCKTYDALMENLESVAYVVNDEVVDINFNLTDGDTVSFLPPVSGG